MKKDAVNTLGGCETARPSEELTRPFGFPAAEQRLRPFGFHAAEQPMRPFGFHMAEQPIQPFELQVVQGLGWIRQAVTRADPDESQFEVALPGSRTLQGNKAVAKEIARRIRQLSPGWNISGCERGGKVVIVMKRRNWPARPGRQAWAFDVSDLQRQKLIDASPAIEAAVNAVHEQFSQFGRNPDAWEVPFPADDPALFVLRQAAKRMQYYSADWIIEAHETPRRITGRRKPTPSVPAEVE